MNSRPYNYKAKTQEGKTIYGDVLQRPNILFSEQDKMWHFDCYNIQKLSPLRDKNGIVIYDNDTLIYNNALFILLYNKKIEEYVLENVSTKEQISAYHIAPEDIEVEDRALFYDKHCVPVNFDTVLYDGNKYYMLKLETTTETPILVTMRPDLKIQIATQELISQMEVRSL